MDDQTQSAQPNKGMNPMFIAGIVILVLVIAGGIYLGNKKGSSQKQAMQEPTPTVVVATPTAMPSVTAPAATGTATTTTTTAVKEFTVHGGSFYFKPNQLTVKKGDNVKITFVNDGGFHDFVLDEFNVKTDVIGSSKSQTVTFIASKTGSFQYYCSVGNHKAMGMLGTLVVQ